MKSDLFMFKLYFEWTQKQRQTEQAQMCAEGWEEAVWVFTLTFLQASFSENYLSYKNKSGGLIWHFIKMGCHLFDAALYA